MEEAGRRWTRLAGSRASQFQNATLEVQVDIEVLQERQAEEAVDGPSTCQVVAHGFHILSLAF